ncbi:MAG TPA: FecR domain-containing protein [Methylophilaceae bacterium]|nr:FecR domain-containing protein [Methylophilaceae bacterium]
MAVFCMLSCGYTASAEESAAEAAWHYTVKPNDSFELIYRKYLASRAGIVKLSAHNQHPLSKKLQPGQVLVVPVALLKKTPVNVQVLVASGDVVASTTQQQTPRAIKVGDTLTQGDKLKTGKYSVAKLRFADGSVVDVQQNSSIEIHASYQYAGKETFVSLLKLNNGRTEIEANPNHTVGNSMQIETPSAIAAVRGTQFRVATDTDVALQETIEGQVAFSGAGQEVVLAKGFGSVVEKNQAPLPPIVLPDAPDVTAFSQQFEQNHAKFTLVPQAEAVAFVSQLARDAAFTQIVHAQVTPAGPSAALLIPDLADGQYYLRLRAQESHGLQGQSAVHAFTVKVRPQAALELLAPAEATKIADTPLTFEWTPNPNNAIYTLQIARDADFNHKVYEAMTTLTHVTLSPSFANAMLTEGEYYWRVISTLKVVHNEHQVVVKQDKMFSKSGRITRVQ